jgi:ABC-type sugar transport system permease subunit
VPIAEAIWLSFTNWGGFSSPHWIGLANYSQLLHDPQFKDALVHNLEILIALPLWVFLPYAIAYVLQSRIPGWRFFRIAFFLPTVFSPVVIGTYYGIVLAPQGAFDTFLHGIGLGGLAQAWLDDPKLTLIVVIAIIIWSTFGIGVLIYLGGLSNLDHEQIAAARVDGANGWQVQRHIVFWQMLPLVEFWSIIVLVASFTSFFPLIFALTNGGPGTSTYTVDFDIYQEAFTSGRLGYASAIGVTLLLIMVFIGLLQTRILRGRTR